MEGELQKIREGVLALMDKNLIRLASTDESKVLYYKMKSDYYWYPAECATDDAKGKATEDTCAAYAVATKVAEKDLVVNHPVRLAMALSSVVAQRQIPIDQTVQKTVETPHWQCIDKVVDDPVVQIPQIQVVDKTPQVHLTGVMKLDDPDAKIKFLADEALHGVGGFVFDANGNRAANVMGGQNCVTGEMWKNKPPFSPSLNNASSETRSQEAPRVWYNTCRRYGSACLEDAGFD